MMDVHRINAALRRLPVWPVYLSGAAAVAGYFALAAGGWLGPDPVRTLEQDLGRLAIRELIAVLAISPLRDFTGINLLRFRRALALAATLAVTVHLAVWLFLDLPGLSLVWREILERPYIAVGMAAFALMIPLAVTSFNAAIQRLGAAGWRRLHRLTYGVIVLAGLHFVMLRKGWQAEPLIHFAIILVLLLARLWPRRSARRIRQGA